MTADVMDSIVREPEIKSEEPYAGMSYTEEGLIRTDASEEWAVCVYSLQPFRLGRPAPLPPSFLLHLLA